MTNQIVVGAPDFDASLTFFAESGFRVDQIFPADDPATAIMSGHGLTIRLDRAHGGPGPHLRLESTERTSLSFGPNGTQITWLAPGGDAVDETAPAEVPDLEPAFSLVRLGEGETSDWITGRAGMHYRDLIPNRLGGRFIASHIKILDGGPVADYVHHHHIRFQMIFCYRGWVDVVYEDQGPAFRMQAGDAVLQPPHIRHQVLESSAGCEVVEIGCPAVHETLADHDLNLPTPGLDPDRNFGGQRFVRSQATTGEMTEDGPWFVRDSGIGSATDGLAGSRVRRWAGGTGVAATQPQLTDSEFFFVFVMDGSMQLNTDDDVFDLVAGDAFVLPAGMRWHLDAISDGAQLLEVSLPA